MGLAVAELIQINLMLVVVPMVLIIPMKMMKSAH
jgi:hypothetical protein